MQSNCIVKVLRNNQTCHAITNCTRVLPFTFWIVQPAANPGTSQFCSCTLKEKCCKSSYCLLVQYIIRQHSSRISMKIMGLLFQSRVLVIVQLFTLCLSHKRVSLVWFSPYSQETNGTPCRMCSVSKRLMPITTSRAIWDSRYMNLRSLDAIPSSILIQPRIWCDLHFQKRNS